MRNRSPWRGVVFWAAFILFAVGFGRQTTAHTQAMLRFVPFGDGLPTAGEWRGGFRVGDLNGERYPGIVHGAARKKPGPPVIFLGDGKGSWKRWNAAHFPSLPYDYGDVEV